MSQTNQTDHSIGIITLHASALCDKRVGSFKSPYRKLRDWAYGLTSLSKGFLLSADVRAKAAPSPRLF